MDRFHFLEGLTWLTNYGGGDEWPPQGGGTGRSASAAASSSPWIILRDASCCFHLKKRAIYFRTRAGEDGDATIMRFEMAVVRMNAPERAGRGRDVADDDESEVLGNQPSISTLFFRIDGHVYLVDHTTMEKIVCPTAEQGSAVASAPPGLLKLPPYASFRFPTVTLRFWMSRLSLSPLNATQPLIHAVEAIERHLLTHLWLPPCDEDGGGDGLVESEEDARTRRGGGGHLGGGGGEGAIKKDNLEHVETFLRAVDTLLHPPCFSSHGDARWSMDDSMFLFSHAGRAFSKAVMPLSQKANNQMKAFHKTEHELRGRLAEISNRLFATKPRNSHGSSGGGKATDMQKEELIRCVECVTGSVKRLTREICTEKFMIRFVRAPEGEDTDSQSTAAGEEGGVGGGGGRTDQAGTTAAGGGQGQGQSGATAADATSMAAPPPQPRGPPAKRART